MSVEKADVAEAVSANEHRTLEYLRLHPDFFTRHTDMLLDLEIPHACGPALSLIEHQVTVLREHNHQLRHKLQDMIGNARDNEALSRRLHRLSLQLMECSGPDEVFATLHDTLHEKFVAERVVIRLFRDPASPDYAGTTEFVGDDPEARALFEHVLAGGKPVCGRLKPAQSDYLFADWAGDLASSALLPLGGEECFGVLAIGSRDAHRFHPGMGTVFLRDLAEIASCVLRRHLRPV